MRREKVRPRVSRETETLIASHGHTNLREKDRSKRERERDRKIKMIVCGFCF